MSISEANSPHRVVEETQEYIPLHKCKSNYFVAHRPDVGKNCNDFIVKLLLC